jgi:hypothetical protein
MALDFLFFFFFMPGHGLDRGFGCLRRWLAELAAQLAALLVSGNPQLTEQNVPMIVA